SLPAYAGSPAAMDAALQNVNAYRISPWGLNLPSGFNMDREQVRYVCDCLLEILEKAEQENAYRTANSILGPGESSVAAIATSQTAF
ncbi:MAG TPA: hypothetical protein VNH18_04610, partial [Bryobacteraceae bacterium]|nr:hypothetical protein [Bryobacteraceae bacterium]